VVAITVTFAAASADVGVHVGPGVVKCAALETTRSSGNAFAAVVVVEWVDWYVA
jgi:hypothetical protein